MSTLTIQPKINEFKKEIHKIEQFVKEWENDFKIKTISKLADGCYHSFIELQMALTKINEPDFCKKAKLDCYVSAYKFLVFVENEANEDLTILLINNSKEFSKLVNAYNQFCTSVENTFKILIPGDINSIQ